MTAEGHFIFSIACAVFAKNAELTSILAEGDWWHIISSVLLTCLLPDIDHSKSFLGRRLRWISKLIILIFKHRGFTHSLLALFITVILFYFFEVSENWIIPEDVIQGMIVGYASHIIADMLTPLGVPLLWPCEWRFRLPVIVMKSGSKLERIFCIIFLFLAIWMPK